MCVYKDNLGFKKENGSGQVKKMDARYAVDLVHMGLNTIIKQQRYNIMWGQRLILAEDNVVSQEYRT